MIGLQQQNLNNESNEKDQCQLCQGQNFQVMLNRALYDRYFTNMDLYYTDEIDDFIEEQITPQTCKLRQHLCDSNHQELLKRQYAFDQFDGKIQMLAEYYKFHRDIPKIFQKSIFQILNKYYDRLRHFDYKNIKCLLKQQQGISLTTQKSDQSSHYSDQIIKSRYSTVLHDLSNNSQTQSRILHDFCQKVDKALDKVHFKKDFKGQYYSGQKKFEQYLLSMKKVSNKHSKTPFSQQNINQKVKNYNLLHKPLNNNIPFNNLSLKSQRVDSRKKSISKKNRQITFQNNNNALKQSLKNFKKIKNKNLKSIEKTTANQTISRDQKSKRLQKLQKTLQYQIQKNQNQIFKPFSTTILGLKSNAMIKTLNQIYKPNLLNQKYNSDKSRKISHSNIQQLNKIYQNKLTSRKSNQKIKSKIVSYHNSKDINSDHKQIFRINENGQNQIQQIDSIHRKQPTIQRKSSTKKMSRSKSTSKTLTTQKKSHKHLLNHDVNQNNTDKQFKTIEHSKQKNQKHKDTWRFIEKQNILDNFIHNKEKGRYHEKENCLKISQKPKQIRQRSNSKKQLSCKSISSAKKQRSKSKSTLMSNSKHHLMNTQKINFLSSQKIQKSQSKSNINSARISQVDKQKFNTIDPQANKKNIQSFLQRKLKIVSKDNNKKTNKFFN